MVTVEDDVPMLEWKVNTTLESMTHWFESAGLSLATTKVKAVLFICSCWFSPPPSAYRGSR